MKRECASLGRVYSEEAGWFCRSWRLEMTFFRSALKKMIGIEVELNYYVDGGLPELGKSLRYTMIGTILAVEDDTLVFKVSNPKATYPIRYLDLANSVFVYDIGLKSKVEE